jgi:hypothetical protein
MKHRTSSRSICAATALISASDSVVIFFTISSSAMRTILAFYGTHVPDAKMVYGVSPNGVPRSRAWFRVWLFSTGCPRDPGCKMRVSMDSSTMGVRGVTLSHQLTRASAQSASRSVPLSRRSAVQPGDHLPSSQHRADAVRLRCTVLPDLAPRLFPSPNSSGRATSSRTTKPDPLFFH